MQCKVPMSNVHRKGKFNVHVKKLSYGVWSVLLDIFFEMLSIWWKTGCSAFYRVFLKIFRFNFTIFSNCFFMWNPFRIPHSIIDLSVDRLKSLFFPPLLQKQLRVVISYLCQLMASDIATNNLSWSTMEHALLVVQTMAISAQER